MKFLKSQIYSFFKGFGLEYFYIKFLVRLKQFVKVKSLNTKKLYNFYFDLVGRDNYLIFDIGANVGERTAIFSELSKTIVAVEPNKNLSKVLKARFRNSNVIIINKGCSNSNTPLELLIPQNHTISTFSPDFITYKKESNSSLNWRRSQIIDCTTLDQLIMVYGTPDFCKIDVEGFEKFVIEGLNQKVGIISFELNFPHFLPDTKGIISKLNSLGYSEYNFSFGESLVFIADTWLSHKDFIEYLDNLEINSTASFYGDVYAR
jgi:FkbM family methyltransferase